MADLAKLTVSLEAEIGKYQASLQQATAQLKSFHDQVNSHVGGIKSAFSEVGSAVEDLKRSFNLFAEFTIGGRLEADVRKLSDAVIDASAKANGPFAAALKGLKANFQDLLVPNQALPGATAAFQGLSEAISNPEFQHAAQTFTGALITGLASAATAAAHTVTVLQGVVNTFRSVPTISASSTAGQVDDSMNVQIAKLQAAGAAVAMAMAQQRGALAAASDKQYEQIQQQIKDLQSQESSQHILAGLDTNVDLSSLDGLGQDKETLGPTGTQQFDEAVKQSQAAIAASATAITQYRDSVAKQLDQMNADTQTSTEKQLAAWTKFQDEMQVLVSQNVISPQEAAARSSAELDQILTPVTTTAEKQYTEFKKNTDAMTQYGKQAARNIQNAFAQFLYDPFNDGLKGMLSSFVDTMRKMLANALASQILTSVSKWATGEGGAIGAVAGFFGAATGTAHAGGGRMSANSPYMVGENGPELMVPDSSGTLVPNNGLGGMGAGVTIHNNIDARGSTPDAVKMLPSVVDQAVERSISRVMDLKRRGILAKGPLG